MDNKMALSDYLMILKSTVEVYVHGTIESSNSSVRDVLKAGLDDTLRHQANTYDEMVKYGFYKVNNVDSSCISSTLNKIESN